MENFIKILFLFLFIFITMKIAKNIYKYIKIEIKEKEVEKKQSFFYLRNSVMNKSERIFFDILKRELGNMCNIFPKIRIKDFVGVKKNGTPKNELFGLRGRIKSRHVDFLLCDKLMKPVMAIEIDGLSHRSKNAIERDNFINTLYKDIELPIRHVKVGSKFIDEIENIKQKFLIKEDLKFKRQ
jgi:hypothetical protein